MKQLHVYFSGRVQGVGFRYTTKQISNRFAVSGWVRNLPDGRVELLAEGAEDELKNFLAAVRDRMDRYIKNTEVDWGIGSGLYTLFEIAYTA